VDADGDGAFESVKSLQRELSPSAPHQIAASR
jgi:hypothetical protein